MGACAEAVVAKAATPAADMVCIMNTRRLVGWFINVPLRKFGIGPEDTGYFNFNWTIYRVIDRHQIRGIGPILKALSLIP
jgi:hypothetical protein